MIDKIQPRKLDRDTDQKLVQKTSMIDALNVYVDENLSGEDGNAGVIKPVLGTDGLSFTDGTQIFSADVRVWQHGRRLDQRHVLLCLDE